ncbi:YraN family protein [Thermostilla marina]
MWLFVRRLRIHLLVWANFFIYHGAYARDGIRERVRLWRLWIRSRGKPSRVNFGRWGENAACRYLKKQGLRVVARRSRNRLGEIDIIAVEPPTRTVVFVEVKARRTAEFGGPAAAVTREKKRRLCRAVQLFIRRHDLEELPTRIDVVTVVPRDDGTAHIEWFPGAIEAE